MDKTPIAIALERQIPEYIRGEYALFVDFIKAYYNFLDQTQQRDLEDIRSIENTLDEFVVKFKKELSFLFPTNSVVNERFILQRIKEFYQARGSKESYQFLFRVLFNKDAEIFYPSTQILRASDGKWIQEKSVFVKYSSGSGDLFGLSGKIIKIKTSQKEIFVFCQRVVYYKEDIYEVFIEKAYTQDISIGDTVSSENGIDYGYILPCPAKYKIVTAGAGFEAGQLHYLKTESCNGSLIKITKIGANGSIKKIQIISFGLDYESTFYAQLSNKQAVALQYHHPVYGTYPDRTNGFVDLGYINKQDYFYYDENYTPTIAPNENVFYADGTYVGDIIASFYTNTNLNSVIDEDTAEIKIELGAVAVYPGYYQTSDGFVSDESYIQDGKYYQLFSYVIRIEQQIESYRDIVKTLLHPAGMELYAEYNIKNNYLVSASPLLAFIRRQFLEQEYVTDDEAANSVYKNTTDYANAVHSFLTDVKEVQLSIQKYKSDGTLANETDQRRWSTVDPITFNFYDDSKVIPTNDSTYSTNDLRYNNVDQRSFDTSTQTDGITKKDVTQLKLDIAIADSESEIRYWQLSSITNGTFYQTSSPIHSSLNDIKDVSKTGITDYSTQNDLLYNFINQSSFDITNTLSDEITTKNPILVKQDYQIADSETNGKFYEFASIINGTFYQTSSPIHSSLNDIKDVSKTGITDYSTQNDLLDRTVTYDRAQIPLSQDNISNTDQLFNNTTISVKRYNSNGTLTDESDQRRWSTASLVGGEWVWDGASYIQINPEIRIGVSYSRSPTFQLTGTVTAGSTTVTLTDCFIDTANLNSVIVKISGVGSFGAGEIRIVNVLFSNSFEMNVAASVSGSITFNVIGDTADLAQTAQALDSFPDGSIQGLTKFALSGASWSDRGLMVDVYSSAVTYIRTTDDNQTIVDSFPDGSIQGLTKFALSGASWSDSSILVESTPIRTIVRTHIDSINSNNTGFLYVNAYNQNDALDATTSYSYEAETYSVHDTRAIS